MTTIKELGRLMRDQDRARVMRSGPPPSIDEMYEDNARAVVQAIKDDIRASWDASLAYPTREAREAQARLSALIAACEDPAP